MRGFFTAPKTIQVKRHSFTPRLILSCSRFTIIIAKTNVKRRAFYFKYFILKTIKQKFTLNYSGEVLYCASLRAVAKQRGGAYCAFKHLAHTAAVLNTSHIKNKKHAEACSLFLKSGNVLSSQAVMAKYFRRNRA